jgi:hypothetical protein
MDLIQEINFILFQLDCGKINKTEAEQLIVNLVDEFKKRQ